MRSLRIGALWVSTSFRAAPLLMVIATVLVALRAVAAPAQTFGISLLVEGLTADRSATITAGIAIIVGGLAVSFLGDVVAWPVQVTAEERMAGRVHADLLDVTTGIPGLTQHERADVSDRLEFVRERAWKMGVGSEVLLWLFGTVTNTVTVLSLLGSVHPVLLLLPLLGMSRVWSAYQGNMREQQAHEDTMPQERLADRLIEIAKDPRTGLEVRVFGLRRVLLERITALQAERFRLLVAAARWSGKVDGGVRLLFGLLYAAAVVWIVIRARNGQQTAGDVVLVLLLAPQVDQMTGGIAQNVYWIGEVVRSFSRYDWLREYAKANSWRRSRTPAPRRLTTGIELRDVGFAYPGAESAVLSGVNLTVPAGSAVALVGENGAGKTTLVKLLARMYDPTSGQILVDGVDLSTIEPGSWRAGMAAGFQDFVKFELIAREVVGIGDVGRMGDVTAVQAAVRRGGAESVVAGLPRGLDTQLGKKFTDGVELSGGQWQRFALARAFMREKPMLLLLDEPTAALDPEAEHRLYEQYATAARDAAAETGGITVLVSHRFSTVRMADLIVVMHHGRIEEVGSHEELLAAGGRYAELFELQARAYR
ncbi:ABC transporter ATP-binding protein [Kribbella sandramycini]|uniref:ABC transporter ATP-binding protein n=1 Tax=Kribbella sandramycini TaxID=60450 RepID=A0A7Y4NYX3_9ACTN|nr:ABC transporter ATP-binding protein [Kribbella sandramycini]MBB6569913.1 ATP-binding cassette subfamily B protein [Kribbella sandramycini]NOL40263.1 ABC transporter ATP-binding protein [Kribbella sandramycini]